MNLALGTSGKSILRRSFSDKFIAHQPTVHSTGLISSLILRGASIMGFEMSHYRFGPFDLDIEVGELRKHGIRIRIQKQPFQVLRTLVENAGTVVSREELRQTKASDTFVDFEHGLNAAVNKVRQALGDSSDRAHYIETIPGQGYRFVAPAEKQQPSQTSAEETEATTDIPKRWKIIVPAAATGLAFMVAGYLYFHRTPKLTERDTIVLADFTNTTGDPVFDGTLRQGLAVQLDQSPFLSLVSEDRIQQTLRLMGQAAGARLSLLELAREVCERTAGAAVLDGSICKPRKPVRIGITSPELPHRRRPRSGASASSQKRRRTECPESDCQ